MGVSCVCACANACVCICHSRDRKKIFLVSKDKNKVSSLESISNEPVNKSTSPAYLCVAASQVVYAGASKRPYGQVPVLLYNGEVTLQTASGRLSTVLLDTHIHVFHSIPQALTPQQVVCVCACLSICWFVCWLVG